MVSTGIASVSCFFVGDASALPSCENVSVSESDASDFLPQPTPAANA